MDQIEKYIEELMEKKHTGSSHLEHRKNHAGVKIYMELH